MVLQNMRMLRLSEEHKFKPFDCDNKDLNEFLLNDSKDYLKKLLAVTYVLESPEETIAYFSLANDKISLLESNRSVWRKIKKSFAHRKHRSDYPAVKIGRFAVNVKYQGADIGSSLMDFIKEKSIMNSRSGCAFITVDALKNVIPFYLKNDFQFLDKTTSDTEGDTATLYFNLNSM